MKDTVVILVLLAILVGIIVVAPLIGIWSLNTLFPALAIPYTLATWAAALWLGAVLSGGLVSVKSRVK